MTLDKLPLGAGAVVLEVGGEGALRLRLLDMGIIPKTRVTLIKRAPFGDPIEIRLRGYELTLRNEDAAKIVVAPDKKIAGEDKGCKRNTHKGKT